MLVRQKEMIPDGNMRIEDEIKTKERAFFLGWMNLNKYLLGKTINTVINYDI